MSSDASAETVVYVGLSTCFIGVIGGILNMIVFLSLHTFRENSCAFYLTIMSFLNIGELITGYFPRIMASGFHIDWTERSLFYCKFRFFYVQLCLLTAYTCLCLATINQYCATCSNPRWQRFANIKLAHRLCLLFTLIWLLHSTPFLIYQNHIISPINNTTSCSLTNFNFQQYFIYFYGFFLSSSLPIIITLIFGFLSYRNLRQLTFQTLPIARRELDKQLTTMILIQIILNFLTITPYIISFILSIQPSNIQRPFVPARLSLALTITVNLYYLYFSCPFYIYICVSDRFRRQLKYVLYDMYIIRCRRQITINNEVTPQV